MNNSQQLNGDVSLEAIDLRHLWHPFTQHSLWQEAGKPLIVESAEGFYLKDVDGRTYLDGTSSLWCNVHGHGVLSIVEACQKQIATLSHSTLLGLSHRPILDLTSKLRRRVPAHLSRYFYSDSGAGAVEAALRMSVEWWQKQSGYSAKKRRKFACLDSGYHGDTLGAVGVGYIKEFHRYLDSIVVPGRRLPAPFVYRFQKNYSESSALDSAILAAEEFFYREGEELAAFIIEPIVQAAAGIWNHPREYLRAIGDLCRQYDVFLIVDEVATGFGKTGRFFAHEWAGVQPDILVLGKSLSGGYLPISVAIAREEIFEGFLGGVEEWKALYYGQTYAGNPVAAAASIASLELFDTTSLLQTLEQRISFFQNEVRSKIEGLDSVEEVRMSGFMTGIELTPTKGSRRPFPADAKASWRVVDAARNRGVIIRPIGNVVILMPAVAMDTDDLSLLVDATADAIGVLSAT